MNKITASALVALMIAGLVPATMANEERHFDRDQVEALLTSEGYSVDRAEQWGEYIRAFLKDGSMAYFDPDTLRPVLPR